LIERIDTHIAAMQHDESQRPGGADGEGVTGKFIGAASGESEELADNHVKTDKQHAGQRDRTADPRGPEGQGVGSTQQSLDQRRRFN